MHNSYICKRRKDLPPVKLAVATGDSWRLVSYNLSSWDNWTIEVSAKLSPQGLTDLNATLEVLPTFRNTLYPEGETITSDSSSSDILSCKTEPYRFLPAAPVGPVSPTGLVDHDLGEDCPYHESEPTGEPLLVGHRSRCCLAWFLDLPSSLAETEIAGVLSSTAY